MSVRITGVLLLAWTVATHADVDAGKAAYLRGDYDTARKEFSALAEKGDAEAQTWLGIFFLKGIKDEKTAAEWFRKAAEQGVIFAQVSLGWLYEYGNSEYGKGLPRDYKQAAYWYRRAADQGDADAQGLLGALYFFGQGVPRDYVQAYFWLDLAASHGHPHARNFRDDMAEKMTPEQIARSRQLFSEWRPRREDGDSAGSGIESPDDLNKWIQLDSENRVE